MGVGVCGKVCTCGLTGGVGGGGGGGGLGEVDGWG